MNVYFQLNEESYQRDFKPKYDELNILPSVILQLPIVIPFQLPFRDGTCFTMPLDNGDGFTFILKSIRSKECFCEGILSNNDYVRDIIKTRIEMNYISSHMIHDSEEKVSILFDAMLDSINNLILSYLIIKKDFKAFRVTKEMLEHTSVYQIIDISNWNCIKEAIFLIHSDISYVRQDLNFKEREKISLFSYVIKNELNPFIPSEEIMLSAIRNFHEGFYKEAVFHSQTSIEIFINALLIELYKIENLCSSEIQNEIDNVPFKTKIKSKLVVRLGGNWDLTSASSIVGLWYTNTYELRNRIAHGGYIPDFSEVDKALVYAKDLRKYIINLINNNKKGYQSLKKYFI